MRKIFTAALLFLYACANAYGEIIETAEGASVEAYLENTGKDTLVIFDVKEVLFVPKDAILNPVHKEEYRKLKNSFAKGLDREKLEESLSIISIGHEIVPVNPKIIAAARKLLKRKIKTIALTNGYIGSFGKIEKREDLRINYLKSLGLDFSFSFPSLDTINFKHAGGSASGSVIYKKGVLFTSRHKKGEVLGIFLDHIKFRPKKIIFLDNKVHNMESMEKFCAGRGIDFVGFLYKEARSGSKEKIDMELAAFQFDYLKKNSIWLSDREARKKLKKKY